MTDIVICSPLRTPVGGFLGSLSGLSAADLGTQLLTALLERTGLQDGQVDDVIVGNANPSGEIPALGRIMALNAGLDNAPGMQLDRRCGSGLQAIITGARDAGLEFDVVVVIDPERVLARSPQGLQDLYVGATRATQELHLVQPGGFGPMLSGIRNTVANRDQELSA